MSVGGICTELLCHYRTGLPFSSLLAAVDCSDLPDPANGEVILSGNTFGSTATYRYQCHTYLVSIGQHTHICKHNKTALFIYIYSVYTAVHNLYPIWHIVYSYNTVFIIIIMYYLHNIHIHIYKRNVLHKCAYSYNYCRTYYSEGWLLLCAYNNYILIFCSPSHAHRCDTGFGLVGVTVRVCQENGFWSAQAPTCQSECTRERDK